jgi:hypothetical protein
MFFIRISVFEIVVKTYMTIVHFDETVKNVKMYKYKKNGQRRQEWTERDG